VALTVGALEACARLATFVMFGRTVQGQVRLRYFPFLEALEAQGDERPLKLARPELKLSELAGVAQRPKNGRCRVVVIGASTARGLPDQLLAAKLAPLYPGGVEVVNLAVPAHIVNQEVVMLGLFGLNLQPDLVISLDGVNDAVTASKTWRPGLPIPATVLAAAVDSPVRYAAAAVGKRSQLITLLLKWRERRAEREFWSRRDLLETSQQQYLQGARALAIMARGAGAAHVLVLQPYLHLKKHLTAAELELPLARRYDYRSRILAQYVGTLGERLRSLPLAPGTIFVDATAAFDASAETCFEDEVHLTDRGYELLVDQIVAGLRESGAPQAAVGGAGRWPLAPAPGRPAAQVDFDD
jgi:hypothetical protein